MTKDFRWKTGVNFATNKNEAKALAGDDFGYFIELKIKMLR